MRIHLVCGKCMRLCVIFISYTYVPLIDCVLLWKLIDSSVLPVIMPVAVDAVAFAAS